MLRLALSGGLLRSSMSREHLPLVVILHHSSQKRLTVLENINKAFEQRNGDDVVEADLKPAPPISAGAAVTQPKSFSVCCTCDRVIPPLSFRCLSMSGETGIEFAFSLSPCRRLTVGDRLKQTHKAASCWPASPTCWKNSSSSANAQRL